MRLTAKIALSSLVVAFSVGLTLAWWISVDIQQNLDQELHERGHLLAHAMAESMVARTMQRDIVETTHAFRRVVQINDDLVYIYLVDFDGEIFAHSFDGGMPSELTQSSGGDTSSKEIYLGTESLLEISHSLISGMPASLHVGLSKKHMNTAVAKSRQQIVMVSLAIGLVISLLSILFSRRITRPIHDLVQQIAMYGRGEVSRIDAARYSDGGPEVAILAKGLATMMAERDQASQQLQKAYGENRVITEAINDNLYMLDTSGRLIWWNSHVERITGHTADALKGMSGVDLFVPEDRGLVTVMISKVVDEGYAEVDARLVTRSGPAYYHFNGVRVLSSESEFIGIAGVGRDISLRKNEETELRIAAAAFESREGMMITDADSVILRINHAFVETTGYTADEIIGKTPRLLQSGRHDKDFYRAMWETIHRTGGWQGEVWDRRKNGEVYPKWLTISAVKNAEGVVTHYIGAHYDITERKKTEETIHGLAFFDQLTGLPNRILLLDRLRQNMTANSRSGSHGALLFIDLDNFKALNDTLGHDMGDLLLKQVGQRLSASVRAGDTVARLGGDEFVVMLASLSTSETEAANQTELIGEKILTALCQSYQLNGIAYHSTPSIGVTIFRGQESSIEDLLKQADLAMYKSKATGRNTLSFFDPAMQQAVMKRVSLEADLRIAVEDRQFLLYYQAQVEGARRLTGAEALVRWQHPERGMVPPGEFIPLAEETGLILPLGLWVLETACTQLAEWAIRPEMAQLTVSVNVSVSQFRQNDFVDQVLGVLKDCGAAPQRLKLELTESLLASDMEEVIEKMSALKAKGVGFSLDDFGTGYSSLSYLKRLPLDQLKIDQSFVRDVLTDPNDAAIAKTIIALAQSLGLGVIAEGVETEAQREFLASSGCHAYQGYFFSPPLSLEGFEEFARRV